VRRLFCLMFALTLSCALAQPGVDTPKVALVLGGGAARGAAHIGVIRALDEAGVPIDMIVGTSIGSVVGGLYAAGFSTETLAELIGEVSPVAAAELQFPPTGGLLDGRPFEYMLAALTNDMKLEHTVIPFIPVATDLASHDPVPLLTGDLARSVHASMAMPILFIPVRLDGHDYYDGGIKATIPIKIAKDLGADIVIAVEMKRTVDPNPQNVVSNFEVIFLDVIAEFNEPQLQAADIILEPNLERVSYMCFDQAAQLIEIGYQVTRQHVAKIQTLLEASAVPLREPGDPNALRSINEGWSERIRAARQRAANRDLPLSLSFDVGLRPLSYQDDYLVPAATPLSLARLGFDLTGGPLEHLSLGASVGLGVLSKTSTLSFRVSYQFDDAWQLKSELEKQADEQWDLKFGVSYRYRDFNDLELITAFFIHPLNGLLEFSNRLEVTGFSGVAEIALPLSGAYVRTAFDLRVALRADNTFLHLRAFGGYASSATPSSEQFGFGQRVLMRGTPLTTAREVFVTTLELGWQTTQGLPLADLVLAKPFIWGFMDVGYTAQQSNMALGVGAGVDGLLFGFAPFTAAVDVGYGLGAGTVTLGIRSEIWPEALVLANH
jgi:NTE family protein